VRAEVAKKIRADVLRKYESVRARKGDAIAEAHGGICHGCHVALPPQQFAKLVATFEVMQCPSCFRILIVRSPSVAGASS
jgi:predicted  nucleic acid-binding Zn-ribbon protein